MNTDYIILEENDEDGKLIMPDAMTWYEVLDAMRAENGGFTEQIRMKDGSEVRIIPLTNPRRWIKPERDEDGMITNKSFTPQNIPAYAEVLTKQELTNYGWEVIDEV